MTVAYAQIPRSDRAQKHLRAAEWIASLGRSEDHAETLAHHYLEALGLARSSGSPTDELAERARLALREAGDRAAGLNAFDAAARSYRSALELWPVDDPERPRLLLSYGTALKLGVESGEEELAAASGDLVAVGDRQHAAQAEILLADGEWRAGRRDAAYEHLERAVNLVREIDSSPTKARVLSEVSRYHMLADRLSDTLETGHAALEMATKLGLEEVRAHALDNVGSARVSLGEEDGIRDLERSIEIADAIGSPEGLRAYNNLVSSYVILGALPQAAAAVRTGVQVADRFGSAGGNARWLRYLRVHSAVWEGRWEDALELIEESLSEVGPAHGLSRYSFETRGRIRLARDDVVGALEDAGQSLELGRAAKDPQTLLPALSFAARAAHAGGRRSEAGRLADELLAFRAFEYRIPHYMFLFDVAWTLRDLGRSDDLVAAISRAVIRGRWIDAAELVARGHYREAADLYADTGARPNEAYTRLRAAEQLVDRGRRREADEQLQPALAFWRSVAATRYVRRGESLLAATA